MWKQCWEQSFEVESQGWWVRSGKVEEHWQVRRFNMYIDKLQRRWTIQCSIWKWKHASWSASALKMLKWCTCIWTHEVTQHQVEHNEDQWTCVMRTWCVEVWNAHAHVHAQMCNVKWHNSTGLGEVFTCKQMGILHNVEVEVYKLNCEWKHWSNACMFKWCTCMFQKKHDKLVMLRVVIHVPSLRWNVKWQCFKRAPVAIGSKMELMTTRWCLQVSSTSVEQHNSEALNAWLT